MGLNKTAVIVFALHETGIDLAHKLTVSPYLNPVFTSYKWVLTATGWPQPMVVGYNGTGSGNG